MIERKIIGGCKCERCNKNFIGVCVRNRNPGGNNPCKGDGWDFTESIYRCFVCFGRGSLAKSLWEKVIRNKTLFGGRKRRWLQCVFVEDIFIQRPLILGVVTHWISKGGELEALVCMECIFPCSYMRLTLKEKEEL